jgi:hypothetical protein
VHVCVAVREHVRGKREYMAVYVHVHSHVNVHVESMCSCENLCVHVKSVGLNEKCVFGKKVKIG